MDTKEAQFLQLIEENKGILYKIGKIYQDDADDRDDLVQEMILQLWLGFDSFRGDSKFTSWMYRVALNTAIVFFKKQKRRPDSQPLHHDFELAEEISAHNEKEEKLALFYKAVQQLGKVEKALIYLYMEDQSYEEIAAHFGITEVNLRVRLNRVKNKLKEIIKKRIMNIDELKDAWGQDEPKGMSLPLSTEMLGKTTSVVRTIRKKMRAEFVALLLCYAIIIGFLLSGDQSSFFIDMIKILLFCILLLNGFYYSRFYVFYKAIARYDLNIKNSIRKIVYELELNAEIYKTYSFSAMPFSMLTAGAFIASKLKIIHMQNVFASGSSMSATTLLWICSTILMSYLITYFLIGLSVRLTYGKYIDALKQVMNDLDEDA